VGAARDFVPGLSHGSAGLIDMKNGDAHVLLLAGGGIDGISGAQKSVGISFAAQIRRCASHSVEFVSYFLDLVPLPLTGGCGGNSAHPNA
jgi:hypothetical protein